VHDIIFGKRSSKANASPSRDKKNDFSQRLYGEDTSSRRRFGRSFPARCHHTWTTGPSGSSVFNYAGAAALQPRRQNKVPDAWLVGGLRFSARGTGGPENSQEARRERRGPSSSSDGRCAAPRIRLAPLGGGWTAPRCCQGLLRSRGPST